MGIPVKLQAFEGPLDLLLHLIDKNKVNIYDIPIVEITNQYLEYIQEMKRQDLNIMSEFLVMAATLIDIKSRMLLPPEVNEDGEEEDPRAELVEKLLEYKMYKYMSYELKERREGASFTMYKPPTIPREVEAYRPPVDLDELFAGVDLNGLYTVFQTVMRRQEDRVDPIRSTFRQVERDEIDMTETMAFVEQYILDHGNCTFKNLLTLRRGKMYKIVTFLTILQMMKDGRILVDQECTFGDIRISAVPGAENLPASG